MLFVPGAHSVAVVFYLAGIMGFFLWAPAAGVSTAAAQPQALSGGVGLDLGQRCAAAGFLFD